MVASGLRPLETRTAGRRRSAAATLDEAARRRQQAHPPLHRRVRQTDAHQPPTCSAPRGDVREFMRRMLSGGTRGCLLACRGRAEVEIFKNDLLAQPLSPGGSRTGPGLNLISLTSSHVRIAGRPGPSLFTLRRPEVRSHGATRRRDLMLVMLQHPTHPRLLSPPGSSCSCWPKDGPRPHPRAGRAGHWAACGYRDTLRRVVDVDHPRSASAGQLPHLRAARTPGVRVPTAREIFASSSSPTPLVMWTSSSEPSLPLLPSRGSLGRAAGTSRGPARGRQLR